MIHVYNRHCTKSMISINKPRPTWFDRELCFRSIQIDTDNNPNTKLKIIFDGVLDDTHFLINYKDIDINYLNAGSGGESFAQTVELALSDPTIRTDDIIYFVEDDYLHRSDWPAVIEEGLNQDGVVHVSLYDHPDKYYDDMYQDLDASLTVTSSTHWRATPSTTDTFAIRKRDLLENKDIYIKYSRGKFCSEDHKRFLELNKLGKITVTPIPGWSTHCEIKYISPIIDWKLIAREIYHCS